MRRVFEHSPAVYGYDDLRSETSESSGRKYVTPEGHVYPSITSVLSILSKDSIREWRERVGKDEADRVSRNAAARGTALHNAAERYIKNETEWFSESEMPHVRALFNSIRPVIDERVGVVYSQEAPLYSDHLKLAGRVDLVADFDGRRSIIDFKTSTRRKSSDDIHAYFMQASAYAIMFEERTGIPVPNLVVMMAIDNDPTPEIFIEKRDNWTNKLHETIQAYNAKKLFGQS